MKILLIGSKGFIGSHLVDYFRSRGNSVYGCDVSVDYNDEEYFQVDATNASYEEIFSEADFDLCVNASGASSVPDSFVHPSRDFHLNARNVYLILDAIRKYRPTCKFLNLSSAAVYGNPEHLPVSESAKAKPLSPYGCHKLYAEQICQEFSTFYGLRTCSGRIFSAYGPGLKKQIFWDWYMKMKNTGTITIFGTGNESRDFIYIDDILEAINCILKNGSFASEVINIANGKEVMISQAIQIFQAKLGGNFKYVFDNQLRAGDPTNWRADITRLKELEYVQQTTFDDGIERYLSWLKESGW